MGGARLTVGGVGFVIAFVGGLVFVLLSVFDMPTNTASNTKPPTIAIRSGKGDRFDLVLAAAGGGRNRGSGLIVWGGGVAQFVPSQYRRVPLVGSGYQPAGAGGGAVMHWLIARSEHFAVMIAGSRKVMELGPDGGLPT